MRLTKQTGHAIRILIDCCQAGDRLIKVADISIRLGITKQNVFKIVHLLSKTGFVAAVRGPSGGVQLAKPAESIRIGDVVRAMEVTRIEVDGTDTQQEGDGEAINTLFDDALTAFISVLDQHSLHDLASTVSTLPIGGSSKGGGKRGTRTKSVSVARSLRRS